LSNLVSLQDQVAVMFSTGSVTKATAYFDALRDKLSPNFNSNLVAPSMLTHADVLPSFGLTSLTVQFSGRIKGLKESE
jgi:hypothetical protein